MKLSTIIKTIAILLIALLVSMSFIGCYKAKAGIKNNISAQDGVIKGDLNGDGEVTDADAIFLLQYLRINQVADFNGDGVVDEEDAVYLLYYTFFPDEYPLH